MATNQVQALQPETSVGMRSLTWLISPFASLVKNQNLFWQLLVRDVQSSVRGSALGLAWIIITPLVLVAIYTFVFGFVLKSAWFSETESTVVVPLIYFTGLMTFSFFMEVITRAPEFIHSNRTYVTKIIFPIEILDWVLVGSAAFKLAAAMILLALFLLMTTGEMPVAMLLAPIVIAPLAIVCVGLGWLFSALGTYIRDIQQVLLALGPVMMFVSPIFYDINQVPEAFRGVFWINPLTFVLETLRGLLFFDRPVNWLAYAVYWLVALMVFYCGYAFFQRARRGFADVV